MDVVTAYRRSLHEFTDRVGQVADVQWSSPTPDSDWDVRTLVNHVVYEDRWTPPLFAGATVEEVGERFEGDLLDGDPAGHARDAAQQAELAVTEPGALDRNVHLSSGDTRGEEYVRQLVADHLIHAWDLAVAIGADPLLDADAVHVAAEWFAEHENDYRRVGLVGPRIDVPVDADEQDRLLAAYGRNPDWAPNG
jgi:uncharacterized protein (TIGR03086 family)